ncbi:MAG: nuclear transport factor 2 family protein, partial [Planctomycetota bacterium]
ALVTLPLARDEGDSGTVAHDKNRAAVEACVTDYVQGFYTAAPERLERALSKNLKKMGYWKGEGKDAYSDALHMTYDEAIALSKTWNNEGQQGDDLAFEVTIFEVVDKTACAKVTAKWGMDYFQLAKEGDAWKIHHVLWQSAPPR